MFPNWPDNLFRIQDTKIYENYFYFYEKNLSGWKATFIPSLRLEQSLATYCLWLTMYILLRLMNCVWAVGTCGSLWGRYTQHMGFWVFNNICNIQVYRQSLADIKRQCREILWHVTCDISIQCILTLLKMSCLFIIQNRAKIIYTELIEVHVLFSTTKLN